MPAAEPRRARQHRSIVTGAFYGCIGVAVLASTAVVRVAGQVPQTAAMTVGVSPFGVRGYTRNVTALRESARILTRELRETLAQDSSIRWLPDDPGERPRDPSTGRIPALHHMVVGSVQEGESDRLLVIWQLLLVESARVLAIDTLRMLPGGEHDGAALVAAAVSRAMRVARQD